MVREHHVRGAASAAVLLVAWILLDAGARRLVPVILQRHLLFPVGLQDSATAASQGLYDKPIVGVQGSPVAAIKATAGMEEVASISNQPIRDSVYVRELSPAEAEKEVGNAAFKAGDWAEAVGRYDAALAAARNNRALALPRLGRHAEAEEDCTQVLSSEPHNVKALLRRATARGALGRTVEAAADLQAVLSLEPHNKEAAQQLASIAPPPPPAAAAAGAPGEEQPAGGEEQRKEEDKGPGEGQ